MIPDSSRRLRAGRAIAVVVPALLVAVVSLSSALRAPLWSDEMATYSFALLDPARLAQAIGHVDGVTAPYYFLESFLQVVLPGDFGLRVASVLAAIGATVIVGSLGSRWWGAVAGAAAGLSFALNPLVVMMAPNARPYALAIFFVALALWFLDGAVHRGGAGRWIGYAVALALAGLFHLLALAVAPAFLVLVWGSRRRVLTWLLSTAAAGLALLPSAVVGFTQRAQVGWIPRLDLRGTVNALAGIFHPESDLDLRDGGVLAVVVAGWAVALIVLVRSQDRIGARRAVLACAVFLSPWLVLALASRVSGPFLETSYLAPATVGVGLMVGAIVGVAVREWRAHPRSKLALATAIGLVVACLVPTYIGARFVLPLVESPRTPDDFPALADRLCSELRPGDRLVVLQPYPDGGVTAGVALYSDDRDWFDDLIAQLPAARQPMVNIRTVRTTSPLETSAGGTSGRIWVVGTPYALHGTDLVAVAFSRLGCAEGGKLTGTTSFGVTVSRGACTSG